MKCNIDSFGRWFRFLTGALLVINGVVLYAYDIPGPGAVWRAVQVVLVLTGGFGMFEGITGWCALRAMGVRTRF